MIDLNTWIISDTHFGHKNIIKFCNRPENHDAIMEKNWLSLVQPSDTILHLGDITYRGYDDEMKDLLLNLTGKKLFIWGNHDKKTDKWYKKFGFTQVGDLLGEFKEHDVTREGKPYVNNVKHWGFYWHDDKGRRILFSHYPDQWLFDWDINIHGHIHNNPYATRFSKFNKDYRNVSVEMMEYKPTRLEDILD